MAVGCRDQVSDWDNYTFRNGDWGVSMGPLQYKSPEREPLLAALRERVEVRKKECWHVQQDEAGGFVAIPSDGLPGIWQSC